SELIHWNFCRWKPCGAYPKIRTGTATPACPASTGEITRSSPSCRQAVGKFFAKKAFVATIKDVTSRP
ncbi:MAG: hypothetical protein AAB932_05035, partial [Patescibacteria group bacterium]